MTPFDAPKPRLCLAHPNGLPPAGGERAVFLTARKWATRDLRVSFLEGDPALQARVFNVARTWLEYAGMRFFLTEGPDAEVRIAFTPGGSWSYVGTEALDPRLRGKATMNLGWITAETDDDEVRRVVLHEFGHALGLIHEHQHPLGGIPWNREKVYAAYGGPPNRWSREEVDRNIFREFTADRTQFTALDPRSIMMYPIDRDLTDGKMEVGMNDALSEMDKAFIATMYPRL